MKIEQIKNIVIVGLLCIIFLMRSCCNKTTILPSKNKVQFDTVTVFKQLPSKTITKYRNLKGDTVYVQGKVDTVVVKEFEKATDTVKTNMFTDAIKIRQYKQEFKDSLADVSIFAETRGELLKMAPTVTIKARLPEKKTTFALYGGGGLYLYKLDKVSYKLNLRFQNKKGDLFSGSYDPATKSIFVDYDFRLLNIKK